MRRLEPLAQANNILIDVDMIHKYNLYKSPENEDKIVGARSAPLTLNIP